MHPLTDSTRQILILRYLTPMGEYQELLVHMFEQNALGLILNYMNFRETRDSRLSFEALKYLGALLCHKKFAIEFIHAGGLHQVQLLPLTFFPCFCSYSTLYQSDLTETLMKLFSFV